MKKPNSLSLLGSIAVCITLLIVVGELRYRPLSRDFIEFAATSGTAVGTASWLSGLWRWRKQTFKSSDRPLDVSSN